MAVRWGQATQPDMWLEWMWRKLSAHDIDICPIYLSNKLLNFCCLQFSFTQLTLSYFCLKVELIAAISR